MTTIKPLCTGAELVNASSRIWWKALSGDTTNDWVLQQSPTSHVLLCSSMTLNVPSEYTTIQAALAFLNDKVIAANAIVTIQVADGNYEDYSCVEITHHDSDKIRILGNTNDCTQCELQFVAGQSGFVVDGRRLGYLDGFKLVGTDPEGDQHGIHALNSGTITCGSHVGVETFDYGFWAELGSNIRADGCYAYNCASGFIASYNSSIYATSCRSWANDDNGFFASSSSAIYEPNLCASNNANGCCAYGSSSMNIPGAVARNNSGNGFIATCNSFIGLGSASASSGNVYGILAQYGSIVNAGSATVVDNSTNYSPTTNTVGNQNSYIAN